MASPRATDASTTAPDSARERSVHRAPAARGVQNAQIIRNRATPANDNTPGTDNDAAAYSSVPPPDEAFRRSQAQNAQLHPQRVPKEKRQRATIKSRTGQIPTGPKLTIIGAANDNVTLTTLKRIREAATAAAILASPWLWALWVFGVIMFALVLLGYIAGFAASSSILYWLLTGVGANSTLDAILSAPLHIGWALGMAAGWMSLMIVSLQLTFTGIKWWRGKRVGAMLFAAAMYAVPFLLWIPWFAVPLLLIMADKPKREADA